MLTFSDWKTLTEQEQEGYISALFLTSCYDGVYIYRPIKMLPELFQSSKKCVLQNYPNGEYIKIVKQPITYETYNLLYHWITGACIECFNHSLVWDKKGYTLLYYCRYCGKETSICNSEEL